MSSLLLILLSAVLVSLVAICGIAGWRPFLDTDDPYENAVGLAQASLVAVPLAATVSWLLATFVLVPLDIAYLRTPVFVAVAATVAQLTEIAFRRWSARLPARPAFALLLTANGAALGVAFMSLTFAQRLLGVVLISAAAAFAFAFLLLATATLYERLRYADVPAPFRQAPITLIAIGLIALGCMGFSGLIPE
jgi:electron transport complex protein RnfA